MLIEHFLPIWEGEETVVGGGEIESAVCDVVDGSVKDGVCRGKGRGGEGRVQVEVSIGEVGVCR